MTLTRLITAVLLVAALTAPALAGSIHHKKKHILVNGEIVYVEEDSGDDDEGGNSGQDDNQDYDTGDQNQKTVDAILFGY